MDSRRLFRLSAAAFLIAGVVALAAHGSGVSADGDEDKEIDQGQEQALSVPEKAELKYPNLGSRLNDLVDRVEEGAASAQEAARETPIHRQKSVAVTIYLSGNVDDVVSFLEDNGGDPRNVGEDYIEAYVPVTLLGPVSEREGVVRVREIIAAEPDQSPQLVVGHGAPVHGSVAWNRAGYAGQGVKVGIIDVHLAFNGFRDLMGTELPSTVQARCYTDMGVFTEDLADCGDDEVGNDHGTLVSETVLDIAPQVSLYIANPTSNGDLRNAVDWMVSEGVEVIVRSVGDVFDGPGDGTSPFSVSPLRTVGRAVTGGVVWVNSAGNGAQETWFSRAPFLDSDDDGLIEFGVGDEVNHMTLGAGEQITVQLRWEGSWGGAAKDLDLNIVNSAGQLVALSEDYQSGDDGHVPFESLVYLVPVDGEYGVEVEHFGGGVPDWIQLVVWDGRIEHYTGSGSIGNPSESADPGMLAVGAAHWNDVHAIEYYSSRGPTPDDRVKPDVVGATCGETSLRPLDEGGAGFCGTSQAATHVAGMAALVRQRFPDYTPAQVAGYLKAEADPRGDVPNNTWGNGFAWLPPSTRQVSPDRDSLVALYRATGGDSWTSQANWLSESVPIALWQGVTTDVESRVTRLNLHQNQLTGEIPAELGSLTNLSVLDLAENQLTGEIPTELGSLSNLQELYLLGNELSGEIPAELGNLANLTHLSLSRNQLTGEIPAELGSLTNLSVLDLAENQLTGEIPTELGSLSNLQELYLLGNELSGEIPAELGNLANLTHLSLSRNQLTGEIPAELGSLTNLSVLDLAENQLTGEIPTELGSLSNLQELYLLGNELSGEIPAELGNLANLTHLSLSRNQLTGEIPAELGSLSNLSVLSLWGNQLSGEIPAELGSLTNLVWLYLWDNQLTGPLPSSLTQLTALKNFAFGGNAGLCAPTDDAFQYWLHGIPNDRLRVGITPLGPNCSSELTDRQILEIFYAATDGPNWANNTNWLSNEPLGEWHGVTTDDEGRVSALSLDSNQLSGSIPAELGDLSKMFFLHLAENQLSGEIPTELGSLANLVWLYLWDNQLSGEIPAELGSLTNLSVLSLWGNQLSGEIPAELGSPTNLSVLDLAENQLTGEIPTELGSLTNLSVLALAENQLTGEIPTELGSLTNLSVLALAENQLTGEIPTELGSLSNLQELYLLGNELSGEIPAELGSLTNLTVLALSVNEFSGEMPQGLTAMTALEYFGSYSNQGLCAPVDDAFQAWLQSISTFRGSSCAPADSTEDRAVLAELYRATDGVNWGNNANWLSDRPIREWRGVTNDVDGRVTGLYLFSNQLIGEIPAELGSLSNLSVLSLWGNQLTGEIPAELGDLPNLDVLYLSQNRLTGCIPNGLQSVTNNDFSELGLPFCVVGSVPEFPAAETGARSVAENTAAGENIGDPVAATDPEGDALTYTLGGADADSFDIDPATGQLMTKAALDFETKASYSVEVTADDGNGESAAVMVTITVTDVNEAPVFAEESVTLEVAENTAAGENIGAAVAATDPEGDTLTYTLGGDDAASFDIDAATGQLMTKAALDFETKASYSVEVTADDGNGESATIDVTIGVIITVTDVNEAPVFAEESVTLEVAENTAAGEDIGAAVAATDPDAGDTLTYTLGGDDANSFDIDSTTGQLMTKAALDFETKASYSVEVTADDGNGGTDTIDVTITVTDVTTGNAAGDAYDSNEDGTIDVEEALDAVDAYFDGDLDLEGTLDVIDLYFDSRANS